MRRVLLYPWILVLVCAAPAWAVEPWTDPNLKIADGLEIWLDAGRLNAARAAAKIPPIPHGLHVGLWYDGSGNKRHLIQKTDSLQPFFHSEGSYTAVRFDGERRWLTLTDLGLSFKNVTIFVVAAPFANTGDFRGLLALNKAGKNDYVSGLNIDLGPGATPRFQALNIEGAGFGGAANLLRDAVDFGVPRRLCVTSTVGAGGTRLYADGKLAGQRNRTASALTMDQFTVGARYYTNGGPPEARGFFDGDILEVLLYSRVLTDAERSSVEAYLAGRYAAVPRVAMPKRPTVGKPLVRVADVPPVQMLVPGFTVRQLPVDLTNINNVKYRADGKLVALAYDGNVYLLSDSDGDGLEDKVELFWDNKGRIRAPIGMDLTPPQYKLGSGLFIASKGKCSLVVDSTGGDRADKEIVIADGWDAGQQHGVDALGVAFDPRDESVFFGLGTASYTNGYQIDKSGKSQYRLDNQRGTIMRVAPDFKSRTIVCTGIRFPVGIRFNHAGDLFCTDQEGATWLANGNPLDELLHIEKGRHYGFPPRHPRHLPKVIDEPSVFDYGPQHQSTCGLNFNEPVNGGPVFGPSWWQSDVFVTGYSRGKLYRTKLVKSRAGYVAQNQLIAALNMLTVDACVSPKGDLVVAVHSGGPDWGSGPNGKGKLYKITYTGKDLPQPVLTWAQSPREVRVAFDRPIDTEDLRKLAGKANIEFGKYVSAGDRFELHRPGYQVVQDQLRAPRFDLPIVGVQATADRRTLILATAPHPEASSYALTLPGLGRLTSAGARSKELPQIPETDLRYDLGGVEAEWRSPKGDVTAKVWLPHLDLDVSRTLTRGSALHNDFWKMIEQPGTLTIRTKLNLWQMLRPVVQPGAKIDHQWPTEEVFLDITTVGEMPKIRTSGQITGFDTEGPDGATGRHAHVTFRPGEDHTESFELGLVTTTRSPTLGVTFHTNEDPRTLRALPLRRFLLPWASLKKDATIADRDIPELKGGNWERGRQVFVSDQAGCARCHSVGGQGGNIGPDLSNLPQRDYASVLRDIMEPSFAIHPDYITHIVTLKDGRVVTGTVRTDKDAIHVGDEKGQTTAIPRTQIESMQTSPVSIMPGELHKQIGPEKMKDLLTFLLTDPPRMPEYGKGPPPPPRDMKEVKAVLAGAPEPPAKTRPIHIVLVAGKKDHGLGEHDYPAWQKVWHRLMSMADDIKVTSAWEWPTDDELKTADVMVFYQHGKWTAERGRAIDAYLERGGGLVYIHWAVDGGADAPAFAQRIGLAWGKGAKFRHGPLELGFATGKRHPIARNFDKLKLEDESYWNLTGDTAKINLLASGIEDGKVQPLFWTLEPAKGRVFVSIPGHFAWSFDDPLFRVLLLRGIAWTAREPVDRFNALVTPGARIKP